MEQRNQRALSPANVAKKRAAQPDEHSDASPAEAKQQLARMSARLAALRRARKPSTK